MKALTEQSNHGQRVNSIFGEGTSPRLRKVRQGLTVLGLDPDALLNHGTPRLVYGIALAHNFREVLLGLEDVPRYLFDQCDPTAVTTQITAAWAARWLVPRLDREGLLATVSRHTLVHPIRHGARVPQVQTDLSQPPLFSDQDG
jgi:hypothetical protein